jgi:hypothetical protein
MLTKRGVLCLICIIATVALLAVISFNVPRRVSYDGHAIYINGEFYLELEDVGCE